MFLGAVALAEGLPTVVEAPNTVLGRLGVDVDDVVHEVDVL